MGKEAFKASKDLDPNDGKEDHFVEFPEFRVLMINLRRYIELYCAFDEIDSGDDKRIDYNEFEGSLSLLEDWKIKIDDPVSTFAEIDANGGGQVLFNEFAHWALLKGLDFDESLDAETNVA